MHEVDVSSKKSCTDHTNVLW